jgi:hypothetical protein
MRCTDHGQHHEAIKPREDAMSFVRQNALRSLVLAAAAFTLLLTAQQVAAQDEDIPDGFSVTENLGTILFSAKWPGTTIPVCWENPTPISAALRGVTRQAVQETWEYYSPIRFTGWGPCNTNSKGIRIRIADDRPHVTALGKYLDARPNGMILNFTFSHYATARCRNDKAFCVAAVAVHEFGHALAFTHEHLRPDTPPECTAERKGTEGDYLVTRYDKYSIMNYCNPDWLGDGHLSELDIEAINIVYPHAQ